MKTINLICYGGPADGTIVEVVWNKATWVSPQRELYLVRRVYVPMQGYKKLLVWHRINWERVDMDLIKEALRETAGQ